jgi:hypothetical protein
MTSHSLEHENRVYCAQALEAVAGTRRLPQSSCSLKEARLKVLKLSAQGLPQSWISLEQAVLHYAADQVRWEAGAEVAVFRGGINAASGQQSIITVNSIIGTKGVPNINPFDLKPGLTNGKLFARDRNVCAYCGERVPRGGTHPRAHHPLRPERQGPLDERGHGLPRLQPPQGQPHAGAGGHVRCCTRLTCPACGKTSSCATAASWRTRWSS